MNKWLGIGRLTTDPLVTKTERTTIARFNLACDRQNGKDEADFISCACFGKTAEFAEQYLKKGVKIAVDGRIQTGSYKNTNTGKMVYIWEVVAERTEFCESKKKEIQTEASAEAPDIDAQLEDELPFK